MNLGSRHKADASFSLSSMTDIVFLLLIFFMLTSSIVTPTGLPVNLPSSKNPTIEIQTISVTVTKDLRVMVGDEATSMENLKNTLSQKLNFDPNKQVSQGQEDVVVLYIDKEVPSEYLVKVASVAAQLKAKVSIATKPE